VGKPDRKERLTPFLNNKKKVMITIKGGVYVICRGDGRERQWGFVLGQSKL